MAQKINAPDDLFDDNFDTSSLVDDTEGIVDIPMDVIKVDAENESRDIVSTLLAQKYSIEFLKEHPDFKKSMDVAKESLRTLLKMKKSNEAVHDVLIDAIGAHSDNASLYAALSRMQSTILTIQKQIDDKVNEIKKLFTEYQLELNFGDENETEESSQESSNITRGTKDFIKQMQDEMGESNG